MWAMDVRPWGHYGATMTSRQSTANTHRHDSQHGTYRAPMCCGMTMAYSGQTGFYCLKCGRRG